MPATDMYVLHAGTNYEVADDRNKLLGYARTKFSEGERASAPHSRSLSRKGSSPAGDYGNSAE